MTASSAATARQRRSTEGAGAAVGAILGDTSQRRSPRSKASLMRSKGRSAWCPRAGGLFFRLSAAELSDGPCGPDLALASALAPVAAHFWRGASGLWIGVWLRCSQTRRGGASQAGECGGGDERSDVGANVGIACTARRRWQAGSPQVGHVAQLRYLCRVGC